MTAASARCSTGIRLVRATVPLPTGVVSHNSGESYGEIGVVGMKGKKRHDGPREIFGINLLGFFPSLGIGFLLLGEALSGSLGFEFGPNPHDGRCRCPNAP